MRNDRVSDEQLILCYRQSSKEAYDLLLKRKHGHLLPLLKKYVQKCKSYVVDMNDIYDVFLTSFHKAIKRFNFEAVTFQTYFLKVLNRDLAGFYRTISNPANPNNNCLSLDQEIARDSSLTFHDVLTIASQRIDSRNYANISEVRAMVNDAYPSAKQEVMKRIILLKAAGYSLHEISKIVNLKVGSVRRRIDEFYDDEIGQHVKKCLS